jgi:hypothetical protein
MSEILFQYHKVNSTTWVYLSSLLMLGLYFKFSRFWSVRNLDLILLILMAPGLLMAQYGGEARVKAARLAQREKLQAAAETEVPATTSGPIADAIEPGPPEPAKSVAPAVGGPSGRPAGTAPRARSETAPPGQKTPGEAAAAALLEHSGNIEKLGFLWLFGVGGLLVVRLLLDPTMARRPLLEPNLTAGGLSFIGCSLFVFLMANVITSQPAWETPVDAPSIQRIASGDTSLENGAPEIRRGPGYAILNMIPCIPTMPLVPEGVPGAGYDHSYVTAARVIAILCHLAVVVGLVAIGYWHFGSTKTGVGVATLYLMLPYTAQMTGYIDHVVPAALLVWAVLCYRRPLTAGLLLGLATSLVYYPLFLLPLWLSFYWRRGLMRFLGGVAAMLVVMATSLAFLPSASYWENLQQMFGLWLPVQTGLEGIWGLGWNPVYRVPVLAAFCVLSGTLAMWPAQKNLGTLLSCSAAVMVATQFWHGYGGGLYMAWYLPLALLTIFRPNLEDRVALVVLGEGWRARRTATAANGFKAATWILP